MPVTVARSRPATAAHSAGLVAKRAEGRRGAAAAGEAGSTRNSTRPISWYSAIHDRKRSLRRRSSRSVIPARLASSIDHVTGTRRGPRVGPLVAWYTATSLGPHGSAPAGGRAGPVRGPGGVPLVAWSPPHPAAPPGGARAGGGAGRVRAAPAPGAGSSRTRPA